MSHEMHFITIRFILMFLQSNVVFKKAIVANKHSKLLKSVKYQLSYCKHKKLLQNLLHIYLAKKKKCC